MNYYSNQNVGYNQKQNQNEKETIKSDWIKNGITKEAVEWAKKFGEELAKDDDKGYKKLTTSQLRKFFGHLKRIQAVGFDKNNKTDLYMLKAQLAYANGRDKKEGGKNKTKICYFAETLSSAIDFIETKEHFKNFVNVVEAIVAFHKAAGGE
jgi:CRISPR-associated protein Csm2